MKIFLIALSIIFLIATSSADIIDIPDDYPTIQEGINAATDGDTVLVQPGSYQEHINFMGKHITLGSLFLTTADPVYIDSTIIERSTMGPLVQFDNDEDHSSILKGFTITRCINHYVGAIYCHDSSPLIINNKIRDNITMTGGGGGISCYNASPAIAFNEIFDNHIMPEGMLGGAGIYCVDTLSKPMIYGNLIYENSTMLGAGGIFSDRSLPTIYNNVIYNNDGSEGGIMIYGRNPSIVNNVIYNNTGFWTGGISLWDTCCSMVTNCIIRNNTAYYEDFHNLFIFDDSWPTINYCNISDTIYPGEGNIDIDPLFRDPDNGDYHLMATYCGDSLDSPCIDMGKPTLLDTLLDCDWGLGTELSDMGAYGGGGGTVDIDEPAVQLPRKYILLQNHPNPFNATTTISFTVEKPSQVKLSIYDITGRLVETLIDKTCQAGNHSIAWQAAELASGIYFARLKTEDNVYSGKLILLK